MTSEEIVAARLIATAEGLAKVGVSVPLVAGLHGPDGITRLTVDDVADQAVAALREAGYRIVRQKPDYVARKVNGKWRRIDAWVDVEDGAQ